VFLVVLACAAAFIWHTSHDLPERVASHFDASGQANGYMPRAMYARFMLGVTVVVPLLLAILPAAAVSSPRTRLNVPNREYWQDPKHRPEVVAILRRHMTQGGCLMAAFLAYVHWLVVRANALTPPSLDNTWFIGGLVVFVVALVGSGLAMVGRFRDVPRQAGMARKYH
jgi:uncharacterized membrane protein